MDEKLIFDDSALQQNGLEREPDIIWNMEDGENPIILQPAKIKSKEDINDDVYELSRFLRAQNYESSGYKDALQEMANGRKRKHWIWYIFPQIKGLGHSDYSEYYGIGSLEEAKAYLKHEVLGERLREITNVLFLLDGKQPLRYLGTLMQ